MPPRDPKLRPDLERALPADDVPGSTRVLDWPEPWQVLFGSGEWRTVRVRAWATDNREREVIDVEWFAEGMAWSESYVADRGKMEKRW
jgi:hypothetical protein